MKEDILNLFIQGKDLDGKSAESLTNALVTNSLQGFDYLKFKKSYSSLMEMGMDQSMAIRSAFATASTLGITKDKLLNSANHYIQVLKREEGQFAAALKKQLSQRVNSKVDETEFLRTKIQEYEEKIAELTLQIDKLKAQIKTAEQQIHRSKDKIESTKQKFEDTYHNFIDQIQSDIELIQNYL